MKFKKSLISLTLLSVLTACGGSSSKKAVVEPVPPTPQPTPVQTVIDGKAIKGTIANAIVTVYKYVDGVATELVGDELTQASVVTEADGSYTVTINDYDGPVKIELSVGPNTTMICDAPAGCGDVAFGAPIALATVDPTLILSAISTVGSDNGGQANVNVSALTHLTTALVEADADGVNDESIQEQSSIIANTFSITGSLTELEPTTVDNATAVAGEDDFNELRYGLINSGIMSALFAGESASANVLSGNLASAINDLVAHNGALLINQDDSIDGFELSLVDVLEGAGQAANAIAEAIENDPDLASSAAVLAQLEQEETNLENQSEFAETNIGAGGRTDPIAEQPAEGDALVKAKAMVDDIRLFSHLFKVGIDSNTAITGEGEQYLTLIENAGAMVEAEAASFLLLAEISNALTALSMQYDDGTLSSGEASAGVSIASYLSAQGATGTVTFDEETNAGGILFTITAVAGTEQARLSANVEFANENKSLKLNISGAVESAGAMFTISDESFVQVNLDTAATRSDFNNDSYDGEIISGELKLDLELAQKSTDAVTNPVTFTGKLHTKLQLVNERVLDEQRSWDDKNQQDINYGRSQIEATVLPEMLTLSGGFSSAQGNVLKATLTVNINDLEDHNAPDFKYIGREVDSPINISTSNDLNQIVITEADAVSNVQQTTETRIFTPGSEVGEWSATSSVVAAFPEEHYWNTGIERKIITKRFDSGINEKGILYTRAYITGEDENNFGIRSVRITPVDYNQDSAADAYQIDVQSNWDNKEYDGTSFDTLMDANGNILTSDGSIHPWDSKWDTGTHITIDDFMSTHGYNLIANPLTVTNGSELLAQTITNWWQNQRALTVDNIGVATTFFSEQEVAKIASGDNKDLTPTAYITKALIKDAFSVAVSSDSKSVVAEDAVYTRSISVDYASEGNFVFTRNVTSTGDSPLTDIRTYATIDSALDVDEVTMNRHYSYEGRNGYHFVRIIPVDNNNDGITDQLNREHIYSEYINADGILVNEDGTVIEAIPYYWADSWDSANLGWHIPFNPLNVDNGLTAYKGWLTNARGSQASTYIDGIGRVELDFSEEEISQLSAGSTTMFDAYNTIADVKSSLEDEDMFLDVNAALSLETTLGDYQVNLMLMGDRTALNDGKFELAMQYKLPDDDAMRKFSVHMKTDEESRLTASNSEDVLVVLKERAAGAESNVIGTIVVGAAAEKVADIEDRDGAIFIVYSDGVIESL
jgi:hypothetical protein